MMDRSFAVRKGAWTEEEDFLLRRCIEKYGEGKWSHVPLRAGLRRCRKSCRLRWLNYLSPTIKRGDFTQDEVDLLLKLHKLLGNRWSLIAGRLPGRTANDIKNFWNTRFNRKNSGATATEGEEIEARNHVSKRNEVIRPQPWTFSKNSKWLLGNLSFSTSPEPSANINTTRLCNSKEMLCMPSPVLPNSTEGSRLEQESDSFDKELEKGISAGSIFECAEDMIRSLWDEDLQPMIQTGNDPSLEEGSTVWDEEFCLDFDFWDAHRTNHDGNYLQA
ncbi:hypothetical protein NE237_021835 [Protea cynaroides]|uniref:Uncharacterized protein n=1 Tax=Protea cynaroides TaxID=273540 RepID=A0A9Q0K4R4_9MAGN|nr:hypothetical protein NE237_021835 [Protea cynaroides]